jgi:hypothetical protein
VKRHFINIWLGDDDFARLKARADAQNDGRCDEAMLYAVTRELMRGDLYWEKITRYIQHDADCSMERCRRTHGSAANAAEHQPCGRPDCVCRCGLQPILDRGWKMRPHPPRHDVHAR